MQDPEDPSPTTMTDLQLAIDARVPLEQVLSLAMHMIQFMIQLILDFTYILPPLQSTQRFIANNFCARIKALP